MVDWAMAKSLGKETAGTEGLVAEGHDDRGNGGHSISQSTQQRRTEASLSTT